MSAIKQVYVSLVRAAEPLAWATGLLGSRNAAPATRRQLWLRSLFAVYDIDRMIALDVPWWTLDAIGKVDEFLKQRPGARVFEYGSGASTVWLARRSGEVISVEHDASWTAMVAERTAPYSHVTVHYVPPEPARADRRYSSGRKGYADKSFERYVSQIDTAGGPFDLIIVDGRCRVACLERAQQHLKPDGIILFDNARRPRYQAMLDSAPLYRVRTRGLTPCLPYGDATDLFSPQPLAA